MRYPLFFLVLLLSITGFGQSKSFIAKLEKAKQGDVNAQNEVGIDYFEGDGVRPNNKKAVYWFRKSAESGYAIGTCNLALHYWRGWGVPKDKVLALKYVFAAHTLDGLKCHPTEFIQAIRPTECQKQVAWEAAVAWLKAHPNFKNNFGDQPWADSKGDYPTTLREGTSITRFPIARKKSCL